MKAVMFKDDYSDIAIGYEYEIDKLYADGHIRLKNSPRRYDKHSFHFFNNDKKITFKEAYRLQQLEVVKKRLGMK